MGAHVKTVCWLLAYCATLGAILVILHNAEMRIAVAQAALHLGHGLAVVVVVVVALLIIALRG